jgi:drug/metabolite transporter (DMT)-like permease
MTAGAQLQPAAKLKNYLDRTVLNSGVPLVVGSGLLFSCSALLIKTTGSYLPVLQICFIRSITSVVLTIAWGSWLGGFPLYGHRKNWPTLAGRGVFGTISVTSAFASYVLLPLGDAATVSQLRQPVSAIMARLLLGEHLGPQGALGGLVSMAGVVVVAHPPFLFGGMHWSPSRLLGMALGVNFCLFSAGVAFTIRRIGRSEHTLTIALWFHTSIVVFTGIALAAGWPQAPVLPRHQDVLPLAGIVATTYLAQLGMTRALQITPVATVAALSSPHLCWGASGGAAAPTCHQHQ